MKEATGKIKQKSNTFPKALKSTKSHYILRNKLRMNSTHSLQMYMLFFVSNTFISNARLKLAKIYTKAKQNPEAELLINMSKKQVCLQSK